MDSESLMEWLSRLKAAGGDGGPFKKAWMVQEKGMLSIGNDFGWCALPTPAKIISQNPYRNTTTQKVYALRKSRQTFCLTTFLRVTQNPRF